MQEHNSGNTARVILEVTDAKVPTVQNLELRSLPSSPNPPASARLSFEGALSALDSKATELATEDKFSGTVLVAQSGKIVLQKSYGLADREKHILNSPETLFRIGSMNKMFTATAILQLVGDGKLDLAPRQVFAGLSEQECGHQGDHTPSFDAHWWHR